MKPEQALQVLDEALQPANSGRISRNGYVLIEQALIVMKQLVEDVAKSDKPKE